MKYKIETADWDDRITLHTTFPITDADIDKIEKLPGVNSVSVDGRYCIDITPGELFDKKEVVAEMNKWVIGKLWDLEPLTKPSTQTGTLKSPAEVTYVYPASIVVQDSSS